MINKKKISVIIPVYNVEEYLVECIESVLQQSHSNLEILLINDGSTDSSADICRKYSLLDQRIKVLHKDNKGVSSARNLGLKVASGDYVGFIDSDDWIEKEMYKTMLSQIENQKAEICVLTSYLRNQRKFSISDIKSVYVNKDEAISEILSYNFPTSLWAGLYKTSSLKNLYLNEEIHHLEDLEFQFRALTRVKRIALSHESFYNYRLREGSANSSGFNNKLLSSLKVLPTIEEYISNDVNIDNIYIAAARSRLTLTISAFLAKSDYSDHKIERQLMENARKNMLDTIKSNIPYKKKILIVLLAISYNLYAKPYKVFKS